MKKYSVDFTKYTAVAGGSYLSFEFEALDETTGEFLWIEVRVSATVRRLLEASTPIDLRCLAAKVVELYLVGNVPEDRIYKADSSVAIDVASVWYPQNDDGEPDGLSNFDSFTVVVMKGPLPESGAGDYNLLVQQEELLREMVRVFRNRKTVPSFMVSRHLGGAKIVWSGDSDLAYDEESIWEDLQQLAGEGLLGIGDSDETSRTYTITKKTLDAVSHNFRLPGQYSAQTSVNSSTPNLDFAFIGSSNDRAAIERDYDEVRKVFSVGAHKSAIILCGSIAEAILLERLMQDASKAKVAAAALKTRHHMAGLDTWNLDELVTVAEALGILGSDAVALAHQLRNYRNVVHPGVQQRKGFESSPGKARAALALLELIVEALS